MQAMKLVTGSVTTMIRIGGVVLVAVLLLDVVSVLASARVMDQLLAQAPAILEQMERMGDGGLSDPLGAAQAFNAILAPSGRYLALSNLAQLVAAVGTALLCVTWCRFFVTGDRGPGRWWAISLGSAEIEMIGVLFLLLLGHGLAFIVTLVVSVLAALVWPPAGYVVMCLIYIPAFLILLRLTLIVPHVACDGGIDLAAAWRIGRGQTWAIFGILGVVSLAGFVVVLVAALPFLAAGLLHGRLDGTLIWIGALGWGVNMVAAGIAMTLVLAAAGMMYARLRSTVALQA